jgi:hypothetical protein
MSGEKRRRHQWKHGPVLIEENIIIDSKSTTITTRTEEEKHIENTRCHWYENDDDDDNDKAKNFNDMSSPNETISDRIERVLRKINVWTNETSSTATNHDNNNIQPESLQDISINKTNLSLYDNIRQGQQNQTCRPKSTSNSFFNSFRPRCCVSTYANPMMVKNQSRPYSMVCVDESIPPISCCSMKNNNQNYSYQRQDRKVRE